MGLTRAVKPGVGLSELGEQWGWGGWKRGLPGDTLVAKTRLMVLGIESSRFDGCLGHKIRRVWMEMGGQSHPGFFWHEQLGALRWHSVG